MNPNIKKVELYFDFSSPYSFLTLMRLNDFLKKKFPSTNLDNAKVEFDYIPILLGPIFKSFGWDKPPIEIFKERGNYMWIDVKRRANRFGLEFQEPKNFPVFSVYAGRISHYIKETEYFLPFIRETFQSVFVRGEDIKDNNILKSNLEKIGYKNPNEIIELSNLGDNKNKLKKATEIALERGVFGAPFFIVDEEKFWGDDRLEDLLYWIENH